VWFQGTAMVLLLAFIGESYLWTLNNGFPPSYMLTQQKFRLIDWGLLPMLLPEVVNIPISHREFQLGEVNSTFIEEIKQHSDNLVKRFGVPNAKAFIYNQFAIGKYEVTYEQYDYYVWKNRGLIYSPKYPSGAPGDNARGKKAVVNVSWTESMRYLNWLTEVTGYSYRLPTEAEWEYSARSRTTSAYWWGDNWVENMANCSNCGSQWDDKYIAPVGRFSPNKFGLYDTAGNVWEWTCSEWKATFDGSESRCADMHSTKGRVDRGGSWNFSKDFLRSSSRFGGNPDNRFNNVGFRVLRVIRTP
jgi:formylglycine-generating enzyme required for sulfatase activity